MILHVNQVPIISQSNISGEIPRHCNTIVLIIVTGMKTKGIPRVLQYKCKQTGFNKKRGSPSSHLNDAIIHKLKHITYLFTVCAWKCKQQI